MNIKSKVFIIVILISFSFEYDLYSQLYEWTEQNSGVTSQLTSVWGVTRDAAWICGYNGTVLRTTNRGMNWLNVSGNGIPSNISLVNICGIDSNNALTSGYMASNSFVYKTTNAGANWSQTFTQINGFINAIWMLNATNGFMVGNPVEGRWSLWKTSNAGTNWDSAGLFLQQAGNETGWNNALLICGYEPNYKILFGTNNSRIYFSSNFGSSWLIRSTIPEQNTYSIFFYPGFTGDGLAGGSTLIKTTNYGANWYEVGSLGTGNFGGITSNAFMPQDSPWLLRIWYIRNDNKIYYSFFDGTNWEVQYTASSGSYKHINYLGLSNGNSIWAVRDNGGISFLYLNFNAVRKISDVVPDGFSLSQNYPNPFNPKTLIKFLISEYSYIEITVFDVLGGVIKTLYSNYINPGEHQIDFNGSDLSTGVYFCRLQSSNFVKTIKMVLIK